MDISLLGKTALVTGASSGIGRSTAVLFAKLGACVSLVGRNEANLEKTREMCQDACSNPEVYFHIVKADLAELDQLRDSVENFDPIAFERLMNVNVRSVITLSHLAVPKLEESKGCIVNVSSVSGNNSFPGILSYSISKAAIEQFTRNAAVELGKKGIRVNCVAPGVVVTELHRTAGYSEAEYASFLMRARSNNLVGATGEADDVARTIAFLAAPTTGAFITV
ncbi:Tropinone reductase 1 [Taenia crassiceps]|uniref:Tropinone reductase 1 n=1 Tax=Taenia crassiceps TaxID=6207 RepID=A0ABR4QQB0_9CEST